MKRQSETDIVDFEEETKSEYELAEVDDISWHGEYEVSSEEEEFDLSGIFLKLRFLFKN